MSQVRDGVVVERVVTEAGCVRVECRGGAVVRAERAVLCPGPWAAPLLADLNLNIPLNTIKVLSTLNDADVGFRENDFQESELPTLPVVLLYMYVVRPTAQYF